MQEIEHWDHWRSNFENTTLAWLLALKSVTLALIEVSPRKDYLEREIENLIHREMPGPTLDHGLNFSDKRRKEIGSLARKHLTEILEKI